MHLEKQLLPSLFCLYVICIFYSLHERMSVPQHYDQLLLVQSIIAIGLVYLVAK